MYKFVKNLNCELGFASNKLRIIVSNNAEISVNAEKIMEAVDAILDGKSLILSGKEITIHGNVDISKVDSPDIGLAGSATLNNSGILSKEIESLNKQLKNLLKENQELADQRDKLQDILDSLDGVFQRVHVNSTRSVLRRANMRSKNGF